MALATQCPHCLTSFRVANDQLKLYSGMVRCGSCQQTFNGIEHLIGPDSPAKKTAPAAPQSLAHGDTSDVSAHSAQQSTSAPGEEPTSEEPIATDLATESNSNPHIEDQANSNVDQVHADVASVTQHQSNDTNGTVLENKTQNQLSIDNLDFSLDTDEDDFANIAPNQTSHAPVQDPIEESVEQLIDQALHESISFDSAENAMPKEPVKAEPIEPSIEEQEKAPARPILQGLSSGIDFELSDEEKLRIEENEQLNQLALETRAAVMDDSAKDWSKHEPSFHIEDISIEEIKSEPGFSVDTPDLRAPRKGKKPTIAIPVNEPVESLTEAAPTPLDDTVDTPDFVRDAERQQRYGKWVTAGLYLGVVVLLVGIIGQSTYFFRTQIAAHYPAWKPFLVQSCKLISCQVKLPAERSALDIGGSEMLEINKEPHINALSFQIQNKSNSPQAWPMLELILRDTRGKTVLQKAFSPTEYLENKEQLAKGIAPNSESTYKVNFELSTLRASGYAVDIFYP